MKRLKSARKILIKSGHALSKKKQQQAKKQAQKENEGNSLLILPMKRIISIFIKNATHAWLITKINEGFQEKFKFTHFLFQTKPEQENEEKRNKSLVARKNTFYWCEKSKIAIKYFSFLVLHLEKWLSSHKFLQHSSLTNLPKKCFLFSSGLAQFLMYLFVSLEWRSCSDIVNRKWFREHWTRVAYYHDYGLISTGFH